MKDNSDEKICPYHGICDLYDNSIVCNKFYEPCRNHFEYILDEISLLRKMGKDIE